MPLDFSHMTLNERKVYDRLSAINAAMKLRYPCDYMDSPDYQDNREKMKNLLDN